MTNLVDNWLKDTEMPPIIVTLATMDIARVLALIYRTCPILSFLGRGGQFLLLGAWWAVRSSDADLGHGGVREFGMSAIINGLRLHGSFIPHRGTMLILLEYARNAQRMAALLGTRHILVCPHDSIDLGMDGPTQGLPSR
jgi:hypothetical protein